MIPEDLQGLFWDVAPETFDPRQHARYTIGRILESGGQRAVAWVRANFSASEIQRVVREERRLSPKSANFWALVYGIPVEEVAALRAAPGSEIWTTRNPTQK